MEAVAIYLGPLLVLWGIVLTRSRVIEGKARRTKAETLAAGLTEPASLHPKINPALCIGCGSCITACPEGNVLGLVNGKAELVAPSHCIGHGACATACPMQGIELVFGTEKRGVDIPAVASDFQTNVPGIYIAGELGGMGLIRNAIEQGRQAMVEIIKAAPGRAGAPLDVVIVGAGPAGISASLAALQAGLKAVTLEQDSFGGTVAHFPRGKLVMTAPADLPIYGRVNLRETSKEELLGFWAKVKADTGLKITYSERLEKIEREGNAFRVVTGKSTFLAGAVLLAIGRRGTPRTLDVPGEDLEKVVYRLIEPEQYRNQRVLVVGGGDSALEAACSVAEESKTEVVLSYRGDGFSRAKPKNRERLKELEGSGAVRVMLGSDVRQIEHRHVVLAYEGKNERIENDAVIVCVGGVLPTPLLKSMGISIETKYGTA